MRSSILIPTYNQNPAYLCAAIQSALYQTEPVEIIVVDDGSNPPQKDIIQKVYYDWIMTVPTEQMSRRISRLEYYYQPNGGVASALNAALKRSQGEYIQWLSSDDLFRPEKTALQVQVMEDAGAMVSYCAYEEGVPQISAIWPAAQYPTREALYEVLQQHCFINACTVIWKREMFVEIGEWDISYRHTQDYEFLLRCARRYNFLAVQEPLVRRRIHPGQMLQTLKQEIEQQKKAIELARLREEYGAQAQVWVPN